MTTNIPIMIILRVRKYHMIPHKRYSKHMYCNTGMSFVYKSVRCMGRAMIE